MSAIKLPVRYCQLCVDYDVPWVEENFHMKELVWEIEGEEPIHAKTGDIVLVPKGKAHNIRTVGDRPSLRLAIVVPDVPHVDAATGDVFYSSIPPKTK